MSPASQSTGWSVAQSAPGAANWRSKVAARAALVAPITINAPRISRMIARIVFPFVGASARQGRAQRERYRWSVRRRETRVTPAKKTARDAKPRAVCIERNEFAYVCTLRRAARAIRPKPKSAAVPGSGTELIDPIYQVSSPSMPSKTQANA